MGVLRVITRWCSRKTCGPTRDDPLRVEGIDGSVSNRDVQATAEFTATGSSTTCDDSAFITVVETEFMLTFDDGPYETETMEVVDAAEEIFVDGSPVRLAFFMVGTDGSGAYVGDPLAKGSVRDHPSVVVSVDAATHAVYNHTDTHLHAWKGALCLTPRTVEEMQTNIQACATGLQDALSRTPDAYFRAPYWGRRYATGEYNTNISTACENLGLTIIWGKSGFGEVEGLSWSTVAENTRDYLGTWNTKADPSRRLKPAIICYHEYRNAISDHITNIVDDVRNKGFLLVDFTPEECDPSGTYYDY